MLNRISPLAGELPAQLGSVQVAEDTPKAMGEAQAWPGQQDALLAALAEWAGTDIPAPGTVAQGATGGFVQTGPQRVFLWGEGLPDVADAVGTLVDLSHARAIITLSGAGIEALLMRTVTVDIRDGAFPVGRACVTPVEEVPTLLHRRGPDLWAIGFNRSYALSQWHHLKHVAELIP